MGVVKEKERSYNKNIPVHLQYYFPLTLVLPKPLILIFTVYVPRSSFL